MGSFDRDRHSDSICDYSSASEGGHQSKISLRWIVPFFIGFALILTAVAFLGFLLFMAGPQLESRFSTIIKVSHVVGSVKREGSELCWESSFEKFDNRPPILFEYHVHYKGFEIPVFSFKKLPNGKKVPLSQAGFASHYPGERWISDYCIELPAMIVDDEPFQVDGTAYYESRLKMWRIPVELPSFTVMPNTAFLLEEGYRRFSYRGRSLFSTVLQKPSYRAPEVLSVKEPARPGN